MRLNDEQVIALEKVGRLYQSLRDVRQEALKELERRIRDKQAEINTKLYPAVIEARKLGIAKARIGTAIGSSNYGTYDDLITRALDWEASLQDNDNQANDNDCYVRAGDEPNTTTVVLSHYFLDGEEITGEFLFRDEMYQGDEDAGFAVERALYGENPNEAFRAALGL